MRVFLPEAVILHKLLRAGQFDKACAGYEAIGRRHYGS